MFNVEPPNIYQDLRTYHTKNVYESLKYRRIRGDMIEMYKIMTAKYDNRVTNFIQLHESDKNTRSHQYKIKKEYVRLNIRKYSFVCRSVDIWNGLPPV
jgi:hypothetical protein